MWQYFLRRLLLVPVTLLGVTIVVFTLTRFLPGGPLEQLLTSKMAGEGRSSKIREGSATLTDAQKLQTMRVFMMDQPGYKAYLRWLGVMKREVFQRDFKLKLPPKDAKPDQLAAAKEEVALSVLERDGKLAVKTVVLSLNAEGELSFQLPDGGDPAPWRARFRTADEEKALEQDFGEAKAASAPKTVSSERDVVIYQTKFAGLFQWEFGDSLNYGDNVWTLIKQRLPISVFYAVVTIFLTYLISIPLGILKAIKHRTFLDSGTSVLIFVGYSIPGFALGTILLLFFAFRLEWFAMRDFVSMNFGDLSFWGKVKDLAYHNTLPLISYLVAAFATTTMLMKNTVMDNLAADYVRTAVSKGASFKRAVFGHAVKNSLIPIATTFGAHLAAFVGGSLLIEQVFDIYGFGLLGFNSLVNRDYPVVMAMITLSAFAIMIGNILSDLLVAWLDPRIRFE